MYILRALFSKCLLCSSSVYVLHTVLLGEGKDVEIQAAPWVAHHVLEEGSLHLQNDGNIIALKVLIHANINIINSHLSVRL